MKTFCIIVICLFISFFAHAKTIQKADLIGTWHTTISDFYTTNQRLTFYKDFSALWELHYENGEIESIQISSSNIQFVDDLIVITHIHTPSNQRFKFVLNGWNNGSKALFGMVYLYEYKNKQFSLFNGVRYSLTEGKGQFITPKINSLFKQNEQQLVEVSSNELLAIVNEVKRNNNSLVEVLYKVEKKFAILIKENLRKNTLDYVAVYAGDIDEAKNGIIALQDEHKALMEILIKRIKDHE